jgi:hypothetical protein
VASSGDEIDVLARTGQLRKELIWIRADGSKDLSEAYGLREQTISEARRWASYYERRRAAGRAAARQYKRLASAADAAGRKLEAFTRNHGTRLMRAVERLAPSEHSLSPQSITKLLEEAAALGGRFKQLSETCIEPLPGAMGRPSNDWLLGFIWRMAVGYRELTTAKISPRGHFPRFLRHGLISLGPDNDPGELESLIKTAIERFQMKQPMAKWLRPGDDLSRFS